jgi:hypothetical protein
MEKIALLLTQMGDLTKPKRNIQNPRRLAGSE